MNQIPEPRANPMQLEAKERRWSINTIFVLLLGQAIMMAAASLYLWRTAGVLDAGRFVLFLSDNQINAGAFGVIFLPLAVITLLVSIGFYFVKRSAWLVAIILQGAILLSAIGFYFEEYRPNFLYGMMLYSIILVLYLNMSEVHMAFQVRPSHPAAQGDRA